MRRLLAAIAVGSFLLGCGATRPALVVRRGGFVAEGYGFACECGNRAFEVLGRTFVHVHLRCPDCHHEWWVALAW